MMVLGQYKAVPVGTWWYWVSRRRYQVSIRQQGQKVFGCQVEKIWNRAVFRFFSMVTNNNKQPPDPRARVTWSVKKFDLFRRLQKFKTNGSASVTDHPQRNATSPTARREALIIVLFWNWPQHILCILWLGTRDIMRLLCTLIKPGVNTRCSVNSTAWKDVLMVWFDLKW